MRELKFDILVRHKATGNTWRQVLTLDELLNRNGCLYNLGIQEIVFKREYTGLKDKNEKDIYVGDIVKIKDDWEEYGFKAGEVGFICFEEYYFGISLKSSNPKKDRYVVYADVNNGKDVEIIGNAYDNPELLK